jgi:hypothetical protein
MPSRLAVADMPKILAVVLAIALAASSFPAVAQVTNCRPTPDAIDWLAENGWEFHDALVSPPGVAFTLYCRGEAGLLVGHRPDGGWSCLITSFPHGCMVEAETGAET